MPGRRVVFIACSLDGFIAGPGDDLSFLEPPAGQTIEDAYSPFFAGVGAMVLGRRTFDVVRGFGGEWPYGATPVLVATRRALPAGPPTARAVDDLEAALREATVLAGERDVYVDGGEIVRQALDAGLIDELIVTVVPRLLGQGRPLFAGVTRPRALELLGLRELGAGFAELRYRVRESSGPGGPGATPG